MRYDELGSLRMEWSCWNTPALIIASRKIGDERERLVKIPNESDDGKLRMAISRTLLLKIKSDIGDSKLKSKHRRCIEFE